MSFFPTVDEAFAAHLRRAADLVSARRLPEAETAVLQGLELAAGDLRARKLLALIRFRLGRFDEAEVVLRDLLIEAPDDPAVHLNLGLVALKLDRFADAATALQTATGLRPDDRRALGYLGYAWAKLGDRARAADAFARAGQDQLAVELGADVAAAAALTDTSGAAASPAALPVSASALGARPAEEVSDEYSGPRTAVTHVETLSGAMRRERRPENPFETQADPVLSFNLDTFALERLVATDVSAPLAAFRAPGAMTIDVSGEVHARADVLTVVEGEVRILPAFRRERGRSTALTMGGGLGTFVRCQGQGEAWLCPTAPGRQLMELLLGDDVLYLRKDLVAAFSGDLVWEAGRTPRADIDLLQFRGTGRVVVELDDGNDILAIRVACPRFFRVDRSRVVGWIGRLVVRGLRDAGADASLTHVACEGEGVLLIQQHGKTGRPVDERPQSGDDGAGPVDSGGVDPHR